MPSTTSRFFRHKYLIFQLLFQLIKTANATAIFHKKKKKKSHYKPDTQPASLAIIIFQHIIAHTGFSQ